METVTPRTSRTSSAKSFISSMPQTPAPRSARLRDASKSSFHPSASYTPASTARSGAARPSIRSSAAVMRFVTNLSSISFYERVKNILQKPSEERAFDELCRLEPWFRKKSRLFSNMDKEPLLDVIKHCFFEHVAKDKILSQQGYTGNKKNMYIILRGRVVIMFKDSNDDGDTDGTTDVEETDRQKLGITVGELRDGKTFGELSLINNDSVRTATYVTDEPTDLIVVGKDVFQRSIASLVNDEYMEKMKFITETKWFNDWAPKWRQELAESISRQSLGFNETLIKQGDLVDNLYFIVRGELQLIVNPESHKKDYASLLRWASRHIDDGHHAPLNYSLTCYLSQKSSKAKRLKSAHDVAVQSDDMASIHIHEHQLLQLPSEYRRQRAALSARRNLFNMCYLEPGQLVGDVELCIGLKTYHTSAISTSPDTVVIKLPRIHYERLFVNKNPQTVSMISHNIGFHVQQRLASDLVSKRMPLIKAIMLQLDHLNGTHVVKRKVVEDEDEASEEPTEYDGISSVRAPSKSLGGSKSAPPVGRKEAIGAEVLALTRQTPQGFSGLPDALQKYLNTQIQHALETEPGASQEASTEASAPKSQYFAPGVHALAQHTPVVKEELPKHSPLNARHGIFFKMLQVSNPHIDKKHLAIEEEEYNYLCQLRRRITKNLNEYYPFASLESFLQLGEDAPKTGRLCRKGQLANTSQTDDKSQTKQKRIQTAPGRPRPLVPNTPTKTSLKKPTSHGRDAGDAHVRFS